MKKYLPFIFQLFSLSLMGNPAEPDSALTTLNEVVVIGEKLHIEQHGRDLTISNIKGSSLASAGTILDMMAWTPGVSMDAMDNIKVVGAGTPLIYINDIRQNDNSRLQLISSELVKKIEIIRDPGSEYPSGTTCVIRITTSKPLKDIIGLNIIDSMTQRRRFSNATTANTFGSIGKFDFMASAGYRLSNSRQSASSTETIIGKNNDVLRYNTTEQQDYIHSDRWEWLTGVTYNINKNDNVQIDYSGNRSVSDRTFANDRYTQYPDDVNEICYDSRNHGSKTDHTVLSSYIHSFDNSILTFNINYHLRKSESREDIYIMPEAFLDKTNLKDSKSYLLTLQADYSWSFTDKDKQSAGLYGGRSSSRTKSDFTFTGLQNVKASVQWSEMYYSTKFDALECTFTAGIRGRLEKQQSLNNLNTEISDFSKTYFNLVPNISIWHRFTRSFGMNLLYRYDYDLPTFSQLNPTLSLNDLIFYETGNPDLKITRSHYLALAFNIKSLTLAAEYRQFHNQIMDITYPIENTEYFIVRPVNMSGLHNMAMQASYNLNLNRKFRLYAFGKVKQVHSEYYYADELVKQNNISASIYINGNYDIRKNLNIFATAGYWSPQLIDNYHQSSTCNISFGGNLRLLESRLNLRLAVNDLLARSVTPSWTSFSPNLKQTRINRYDTRSIMLTASYQISMLKKKYSQLDNADDYWRM